MVILYLLKQEIPRSAGSKDMVQWEQKRKSGDPCSQSCLWDYTRWVKPCVLELLHYTKHKTNKQKSLQPESHRVDKTQLQEIQDIAIFLESNKKGWSSEKCPRSSWGWGFWIQSRQDGAISITGWGFRTGFQANSIMVLRLGGRKKDTDDVYCFRRSTRSV